MKRVWQDGIRFGAGALLSVAAVYALSEALDPVYPEMRARVSLFRARGAEVEMLSVGNSHTIAIHFPALGAQGMHFYDPGQDPFEAAYMVRYAADRAPRLRYVLMTASYGFERLDNAALTSRDYSGNRRGMYLRTRDPRFIPGDHNLWLGALLAPVARTDQWAHVAGRLVDGSARPVSLAPDGKRIQPQPPLLSADSLARYAPWQAGVHRDRRSESLANAPRTPARTAEELDALAGELQARGVVLVLFTPPYHHTFLRQLPAELRDGTRRALRPVLRRPNVAWLDFGAHPAFTHRDDLFKDSDHLNPAGSRAFSALLRRCLAALPGAAGGTGAPVADCPGGEQPAPGEDGAHAFFEESTADTGDPRRATLAISVAA